MNKNEFMKKLKTELKHIQKDELDDILEDYEEHFRIGKENGRSEKELVKSLGDVKTIAKQITVDYHVKTAEESRSVRNITKAIFTVAGLGFFNLIFVLGPFIGLLGFLFGLFGTSIALTVSGIAVFVVSVGSMIAPQSILFGVTPVGTMFAGIGLICLGILFTIGNCYLAKWFYIITIKYLKWNISIVKGKEE